MGIREKFETMLESGNIFERIWGEGLPEERKFERIWEEVIWEERKFEREF